MKQYVFTELGFFTQETVKALKEEMDGKTFMDFNVTWSNCAGNCTLIIETDSDAAESEIKGMFLNCALTLMSELKNR